MIKYLNKYNSQYLVIITSEEEPNEYESEVGCAKIKRDTERLPQDDEEMDEDDRCARRRDREVITLDESPREEKDNSPIETKNLRNRQSRSRSRSTEIGVATEVMTTPNDELSIDVKIKMDLYSAESYSYHHAMSLSENTRQRRREKLEDAIANAEEKFLTSDFKKRKPGVTNSKIHKLEIVRAKLAGTMVAIDRTKEIAAKKEADSKKDEKDASATGLKGSIEKKKWPASSRGPSRSPTTAPKTPKPPTSTTPTKSTKRLSRKDRAIAAMTKRLSTPVKKPTPGIIKDRDLNRTRPLEDQISRTDTSSTGKYKDRSLTKPAMQCNNTAFTLCDFAVSFMHIITEIISALDSVQKPEITDKKMSRK